MKLGTRHRDTLASGPHVCGWVVAVRSGGFHLGQKRVPHSCEKSTMVLRGVAKALKEGKGTER